MGLIRPWYALNRRPAIRSMRSNRSEDSLGVGSLAGASSLWENCSESSFGGSLFASGCSLDEDDDSLVPTSTYSFVSTCTSLASTSKSASGPTDAAKRATADRRRRGFDGPFLGWPQPLTGGSSSELLSAELPSNRSWLKRGGSSSEFLWEGAPPSNGKRSEGGSSRSHASMPDGCVSHPRPETDCTAAAAQADRTGQGAHSASGPQGTFSSSGFGPSQPALCNQMPSSGGIGSTRPPRLLAPTFSGPSMERAQPALGSTLGVSCLRRRGVLQDDEFIGCRSQRSQSCDSCVLFRQLPRRVDAPTAERASLLASGLKGLKGHLERGRVFLWRPRAASYDTPYDAPCVSSSIAYASPSPRPSTLLLSLSACFLARGA